MSEEFKTNNIDTKLLPNYNLRDVKITNSNINPVKNPNIINISLPDKNVDSYSTKEDKDTRFIVMVLFSLFTLGAILLYFSYASEPRVVIAAVHAKNWKTTVIVDRYILITNEGWKAPPDAIDVVYLGQKIHHHEKTLSGTHVEKYQNSYVCKQECQNVHTPCAQTPVICKSDKSGAVMCTKRENTCRSDQTVCVDKYCVRTMEKTVNDFKNNPVYKNWYAWKSWDWRHDRTISKSGTSSSIIWPSELELKANLAPGEKERFSYNSFYHIEFIDQDRRIYGYTVLDIDTFMYYEVGKKFRLQVTPLGISSVFPYSPTPDSRK